MKKTATYKIVLLSREAERLPLGRGSVFKGFTKVRVTLMTDQEDAPRSFSFEAKESDDCNLGDVYMITMEKIN